MSSLTNYPLLPALGALCCPCYAPIFLRHAKEIMGADAFRGFLHDVCEAGAIKIIHTEEILKILRSCNDSPEMNELFSFCFDENAA